MLKYNLSHITTTGIMEPHVDQTSDTGEKMLCVSEIIKNPSEIEETVSDILNDAKLIVSELNSKSLRESKKEERMSRPQAAVPQEKPQEILEAQQSRETDSLMNTNSGSSSKEDATNNDVTPKTMSEEEKLSSEIQEEKQSLEELKVSMDKYLPASLNVDIQESSKENKDYFREDSKKDESYFISLGSLPTSIQPQVYKNAMEIIRDAKNNIRKLLGQLYEAIELTYQSKQNSDDQKNYYKALFELWIKWSRSLSEEDDDKIQLLEIRTLGMSRSIALKLQSAFMDLMPKVQDLPTSLQNKMQQACYNIQELQTTFSLTNKFEDLDKYHLTQSQLKLTQAQGSIEELFFFLENDVW